MVIYGILFGSMHHVVFISMTYMKIEMFPVSVVAPNATMVIYGILFGGICVWTKPVLHSCPMCGV